MTRTVCIADVAEVIRGVTYDRDSVRSTPAEDALPLLRAGNIQDQLELDEDLVWVPRRMVSEKQVLRLNDLVMCTSSGSADIVGKTALFERSGWSGSYGAFCAVVRPDPQVCHPAFMRHVLRSRTFLSWARSSLGANIKNIRKSELERFQFELPDGIEQQRISTILDKAESLRRKRQKVIRLADDLLRSTLLTCLEQPCDALVVEQLLSVKKNAIRTGPFGSQLLHAEFTESGVPVLGIDNVVTNRFRWDERRYVSADKYEQLSRYTVYPGDVIVTIMGTTGRVAVAPDDLPICISTKHLCTMTVDRTKILPEFLWACLLWDPAVHAQSSRVSKGAIMDGLNMGIVKGLLIKVPSMDVQQRFVSVLRKVDALRSKYKVAVDDGASLNAALTSRLLAGSSQH